MIGNTRQHVRFHYITKPFSFPQRTILKQHISLLFKTEHQAFESLSYVFCTDDYLLDINRKFLLHNYYTDIITFNLANKKDPVMGEIYISVDRVAENARLLNESFRRELLRVILHGALHLCGYGDKTRKQALMMRNKEDYYLNLFVNI